MKTKLLTLLAVAVVLIAWVPRLQLASPIQPILNVQPVYENGEVVACQHYYSVQLKTGGEFRYQWQPELDAFIGTNDQAFFAHDHHAPSH